ncbi:GATA transcription factor 16 [Capsicum annuum]|nr:GATA transcription factor 16 [Capsicum annuum]
MNIPTYTNSSSSSFPFELNNNEVQYDLSQYNSYQFASSSSNSSCQNFFNISTTNIHDQSGYDHFHSQFHQPQHHHEVDNFGSRSSGSHDQLEKKNKGLKLTLWKNKGVQKLKNNNLDYTNSKLKLEDQNDYNNNNIIPIRVCSDCNTTKTPLWRSGPKGPKSLCNACGIRQRKARRAAAAAATATNGTNVNSTETSSTTTTITTTTKVKVQQQKNKTTKVNTNHVVPFKKRCKFLSTTTTAPAPAATATAAATAHCTLVGSSSSSSSYNNNNNNNNNTNQKQKLCFEDFFVNLSNNLAIHRVFPQDEKEAAILLMALSSGLVHG